MKSKINLISFGVFFIPCHKIIKSTRVVMFDFVVVNYSTQDGAGDKEREDKIHSCAVFIDPVQLIW